MTNIQTSLTAIFNSTGTLGNNSPFVRSTNEWRAKAQELGMSKGRDAAKDFAGRNGCSVMVWSNGHTALYVRDDESGDIIRIKFNGSPASQTQAAVPMSAEQRAMAAPMKTDR